VWLRNRRHIGELIAGRADRWLMSRPGLALLVELSGLSERTVQDCCRWYETRGWLAVTEPGTTPRYAPDRLRPGDGNLAREWRLCWPDPDPDPNCTPSQPFHGEPSAGTREDAPATVNDEEDRRCAPGSSSPSSPWSGLAPSWPMAENPQRRGERLTAAETLRRRSMTLRRLSARHLRSILRPWFGSPWGTPPQDRWRPCDVLHALDYQPDGTPHLYVTWVRDPARWLEHRLSFWLGPDGRPLPPHSARLAIQAAAHRAQAARARAERQAADAARLAPADGYPGQAAAAAARGGALAREIAAAAGGRFATALRLHQGARTTPAGPGHAPPRWYSRPPGSPARAADYDRRAETARTALLAVLHRSPAETSQTAPRSD